MENQQKARRLPEAISKLTEQRVQLHESLGGLLYEARSWEQREEPELIRSLERLSDLTQTVLTEIAKARAVMDDKNAEEFVKNYIQKPGK